jgi:hypothetical protein
MARKKITNLIKKGKDAIVGDSAPAKQVRFLMDKGGSIKTEDVKKFYDKFGERETFKYFGPARAKRAMKASEQDKRKKVTAPIKTPTGTTRARKASPKDKTKAEITRETQQGRRRRPEDSMTTIVGKGVGTGAKPDPKRLKAAKRQSEIREPKSEFMGRMSRESTQGGVELPARFAPPKKPDMTIDQMYDAMKSGTNPEKGEAEDLIKIYESGNTAKKYMGGSIRGAGKATRGFGKALKRSN